MENFAKIARPLSGMTSEKVEFEWIPLVQDSFHTLKQALTTAPVLAYPDFSKPFLVAMDESSAAVGAVLSLLGEDGREHSIYYAVEV